MAYDEYLADRIRRVFTKEKVITDEKKMMGGLCFMVNDKMCTGIYKGGLMARVDPDEMDRLLSKSGASQMVLGDRPMKGFLHIDPIGFDNEDDLEFWIQQCLEFNPKAKSSKKK